MSKLPLCAAALLATAALAPDVHADVFTFSFTGPGVGGTLNLTLNPNTSPPTTYPGRVDPPGALAVTAISGFITDVNPGVGINSVAIAGIVPLTQLYPPENDNLLAPASFSKFAVATGLPPENNGFLSYDNLFYPKGSPAVASDYPFGGGFIDIYGLAFTLVTGEFVNFFSNGNAPFITGPIYGLAIATPLAKIDYVGGVAVPEPGTLGLFGAGLLGLLLWRRQAATAA